MLRYRKLWIGLSVVILLAFLVTSFLKPDIVTVVPDQSQLEVQEPDLHIQHSKPDTTTQSSRSSAPSDGSSHNP